MGCSFVVSKKWIQLGHSYNNRHFNHTRAV